MGISTDSWRASCGTDGNFTGAITHLGYPLFFKEDHLHRVYPSAEGAHQVQDLACRGVQYGSADSLAIVNEAVYYKSRGGVCRYDGSLPVEISGELGEERYTDAVAGGHHNKYYISMADSKGDYHLFVYDTFKGMWHREDNLKVNCFCTVRGLLYAGTDEKLLNLSGGTEDVSWMVQTGPQGLYTADAKYVSRINLRMWLGAGSVLRVRIRYDFDEDWLDVADLVGDGLSSFSLPIRPMRCDHLYLMLEGTGPFKLYSLTKTLEQGSDI